MELCETNPEGWEEGKGRYEGSDTEKRGHRFEAYNMEITAHVQPFAKLSQFP